MLAELGDKTKFLFIYKSKKGGFKMVNRLLTFLILALVLCGVGFTVINLCFYVPAYVNAGDVIFGTEEWIKNGQGQIVGWRCWGDPSNCCVVFAQE